MRVSVIIPFNKGDDYLRDCLNSLSEQEYTDYEILLINDHYEGDLQSITGAYEDRLPIRVFTLEDDKTGVAAARNVGLDHATGEFVYFLDADDYIFQDAIRTLVEAADETNEDMVYGKKHFTYFRRDVFLPIYIEKREALIALRMEEDGEGGTDSDSEENDDDESEDSENGEGDDDSDSSAEEGDYDPESGNALSPEEIEAEALHRAKALRKAVRRLIYKKKRFRNISILHILIRRSKIEEKHLRFDESLKYYSDAPFLTALLNDESLHIRKRFFAHYIKRKHADIVNHPALTQIQDENRFDEMVDTFYKMLKISGTEGQVRTAVEHQIAFYCSGYFLKKVKRSEADRWRTTRFETMSRLSQEIKKDTLKLEDHWRRRGVRAVREKDLAKSIKVIKWRLARKKIRKILKGKRVISRHMYNKYIKDKPIQENTIMFETFFGKGYSDSPKYIYEYIGKNYPGQYNFVWVLDKKRKLPYGGKIVKRLSIKYRYYLATSKYFVFNVKQPEWFKHRKGMIFFECWHGTPLKRLGFDLKDVFGAAPNNKKKINKATKNWDYLLSPNEFSSNCFSTCFLYDKDKMLEYGYPRNDILHSEEGKAMVPAIKAGLKIPSDKKIILYAPTWRDDEFYGHGQYKFELKLNLDMMKEALGDEYIVLLRTHYFIADSVDTKAYGGFAVNVSRYDDIAELYLISDILITDYSSVFFDFGGLKRPMLFYTYDLEKYRDILHGFYMNMEDEVPGPMLYTTEEVITAIRNIDDIQARFAEKYEVFYKKYCSLEDGHAAERCAKKLLSKD